MEPEASDEDSSPEDRELARILWELGRLFPRDPDFDWSGSRRWCGEVLGEIIKESPASRRLTELLEGVGYRVGGDEHHIVAVESDPERVYKVTHGDNFGCRSYFSAADPELTGRNFHGETNADPFFYLERWLLLNSIGGYKTRFEGFIPAEKPERLPRICVSQPQLDGPNPTVDQIRNALADYGFHRSVKERFSKWKVGSSLLTRHRETSDSSMEFRFPLMQSPRCLRGTFWSGV